MNLTKEVRFTREEIDKITEEAVKSAASALIGVPAENEEMDIMISSYGASFVIIRTKQNEETKEVNK